VSTQTRSIGLGPGPEVAPAPSQRVAAALLRGIPSAVFGVFAILGGVTAVLVLIGGFVVFTPQEPARFVAVLASVPQVRAVMVDEMVDEDEGAMSLTPVARAEVSGVLDDLLAEPYVLRALPMLIQGAPVEETDPVRVRLVEDLRQRAAPLRPEAAEVVRGFAQTLADGDLSAIEKSDAALAEGNQGVGRARVAITLFGLFLLVCALMPATLAIGIARHRAATAVALASGTLIVTALMLVLGGTWTGQMPAFVQVIAGLGSGIGLYAGNGSVAVLGILALIPLAAWGAAAALRSQT
jgi:hypothetical protein